MASKIIHAIEEKPDPDLVQIEKAVEDHDQDEQFWLSRAAEEKRLVRKLDKRILPIACLMYLFACKSTMVPVAVLTF